MTGNQTAATQSFTTFGTYLRFLRRRARLTQRELAIAVNYSEGQICHLEHDRRTPDLTTLVALFVPALHLEETPDEAARLLELASVGPAVPASERNMPPVLPLQTKLIGRAAQQARLAALLTTPDVRLVTLLGPPGVGKTHLALHLARSLQDRFRNGTQFIDLSAVSDVALVVPTIMRALALADDAQQSPEAMLSADLREQQILLVLDNVEQIAGLAQVLRRLLAAAPEVTLLLTSRVALRLQIEQSFPLPPLAVPDLRQLPPIHELAQIEAMALLLERLRAVNPDLVLNDTNALALAAICVRTDGLPLAIELVASRGRLFDPQELLSDVMQQFRHMRRRGQDVPERHQTLAAALAWSYVQLSPDAQAVYARLSLCIGKWPIDLVAAVCDCAGTARADLLNGLDELLEHSLLQRQTIHGKTFLSMLVMVREHAQEQLHARGEDSCTRRCLLEACIELAEQAEEQLLFGAHQADWLAWLDAAYDTLRTTLDGALESGAYAHGLRLAGALWRFWYMRGLLREGRFWLERSLTLAPASDPAARAHALDGLGVLAWRQGAYGQAETWLQAALDLYRGVRHRRGEARVLSHIGLLRIESGTMDDALPWYEASLPIYRELGDPIGMVSVMHNLGNLYCHQNRNDRAMALYQECLAIYREHGSQADIALVSLGIGLIARDEGQAHAAHEALQRSLDLARTLGDNWTGATALMNLGLIMCDQGDLTAAEQFFQEAQTLFEHLGDQSQVAVVQAHLGMVALRNGKRASAIACFRQCLMLAHALGYQPGIVVGLEGIAGCAADTQALLAARLFAMSTSLRETLHFPVPLVDQPRHEQLLRITQHRIAPAVWAVAWEEGRRMTLAQAIVQALAAV